MGSINIHDLLSSADLDGTSPLTAPDLRLLIDRLNLRSLSIKSNVKSYINSHHSEIVSIFSSAAASASSSASIAASLSSALDVASDSEVDREICGIAREILEKRRVLTEKKEVLGFVEMIARVLEELGLVKEKIGSGRLKEAAKMIKSFEFEEESDLDVIGFLRNEWMECFDMLQVMLARNMESLVQFDVENKRVSVKSKLRVDTENEIDLHTTMDAMEIAGVLDYGLAKVADLMIKHVFKPAISNQSINISVENNENFDHEAILKLLPSSEYQEPTHGPMLYFRTIEAIKFIHKFICLEKETWIRWFGKLTWPRIADLVITSFLSKAVPDDASKTLDFQNILKHTAEFENSLKEMKYISTTDSRDEKLSHFMHNVEVHFASKKRLEILAKARHTLLQFNQSGKNTGPSEPSGPSEVFFEHPVDMLFQNERCFVSKAVLQLLELVHSTLKDACLSSTRVAKVFYHAARDALLLYGAIIPVKLEKQLGTISEFAIIVHNDLLYLSQEILGLAFEYRADFPCGLKKLAAFADIAPNFHQMADRILQKQIQLVVNSLMGAIDEADGFQNTHQPQQYELAKFSIEQVIFILEKAHVLWEPLMTMSTYTKTMYILLDSVFSRITKDILLLDDMAAEETLQLQGLIHMTLENLSSLFVSLNVDDGAKDDSLKSAVDSLSDKIPSLSKFRKLADLLDLSLKSITTTWESGELSSCGFTAPEVKDFIRAIFTDSPLRKECLWRIEDSHS